jgi:formate-dependent nitrite reductase membrane component NrfD
MSTDRPLVLRPNQFLIGYQPQGEWAWLIATAFFLGKVGAGLFLISYISDFKFGAVAGLLIVGVGKTTAHLLYLGRPLRFLRAVVGWRTSWISRGIIAMGVYLACGAVYVAPYLHISFVPHDVASAFGVVAVVAAVVVMVYDGFVLKASRGVPLWDSYLMPVLVLFYALLGGVTLTLTLEALRDETTTVRLDWLQLALLGLNLVLIVIVVLNARVRHAAAQYGSTLLTRGPLGWLFLAGAVGVGLVGTLVLAGIAIATGNEIVIVLAAITDLAGHFFVFFSILRAGLHAPIRPLPLRRDPGVARPLPTA